MNKLLASTALVALLAAAPAFATGNQNNNNSGDTYNDNSVTNQYFNPTSSSSANANSTNTLSTKQLNEQSLANSNANTTDVNVKNSGDKFYYAPGLALALPSGANAEMAPEGWSASVSGLFAGFGFGRSYQKLTPAGVMNLANLGELASRQYMTTATEDDKVMSLHIANALCVEYPDFANRENLCDR